MASDECLPLKTVQELYEWKSEGIRPKVESIRLRTRNDHLPRTLLCHDMMGGYLDDKFVHGVDKADCYRFFHWANVDIFVYFSHNLITIPPCGWITAAHKNGTLILGTFITEWEEGRNMCKEFLMSHSSVSSLASQLACIAKSYGFDGWLLNIENTIEPEKIGLLEDFVSILTKKMHAAVPNSCIIWYDSVIETGELKWQNELNEHNRRFFDVCDGIFLNYTWKEDNLKKSVDAAQSRLLDVYVGIDIFGRGCCGGGGFSTNIALKNARDWGLSAAIFAPGWVFETLERDAFTENQYKFWNLLQELCPPHGPAQLPFITSFCQGFGKKLFRHGKIISNSPWTNLALQQPQPTFHHWQDSSSANAAVLHTEQAYHGGGCLKLHGLQKHDNKFQTFKLFSSHFPLKQSTVVTYTFKPVSPQSVDCMLLLHIANNDTSYCLQLVAEQNKTYDSKSRENNHRTLLYAGELETKTLFCSPQLLERGLESFEEFGKLPYSEEGWITRAYILDSSDFEDHIITSIEAAVLYTSENPDSYFTLLLGQTQVLPLENNKPKLSELLSSDITKKNQGDNGVLLSVALHWNTSTNSSVECWDVYSQYCGEKTYCGTTTQDYYKLTNILINSRHKQDNENDTKQIEFHVQPSGFIHNAHRKINSKSLTVAL